MREEGIKAQETTALKRQSISTAGQPAQRPCQVWSWDFVADQTEDGSRFRILTLLEYTRPGLAIHPVLVDSGRRRRHGGGNSQSPRGVPEHLRSDNSPEFIASCIRPEGRRSRRRHQAGKPLENGHIETSTTSFAMNASTPNFRQSAGGARYPGKLACRIQ